MTDLAVYVVLGVLTAVLVLGVVIRDEIVRHYRHHRHHTHFTV